jgi:transcriptional regulator with XRE-family HTH domain
LAEKLLFIRNRLDGGLSQTDMALRLGLSSEDRERISKYERGVLEPPLQVIIAYGKVSNVFVEAIIIDELDLPDALPSKTKSEGIPV